MTNYRYPNFPTQRASAGRLRILVLGYLVRGPLGGLAWHHLQYVAGLARLGHDVYFMEDSDDYPSCYDPTRDITDTDCSYGLAFATNAFARLGLDACWCYYDAHRRQWLGPCADRALEICTTADLLLNVSAVNPIRPWLEDVPLRVLIDTDPVFTQVRHLTDESAAASARRHTHFFSFAENIGQANCRIPDDGLPWKTTRQPVVLDAWQDSPAPDDGRFTTIMQWKSYSSVSYNGDDFGMKGDAFMPYLDLPRKVNASFELAIGSPSAPRELLSQNGWIIMDPREPCRDPWIYQDYIRSSKAEFSVAKHGYVVSRSGWFSERSANYLASSRPVVLQDTGFSAVLPTGEGLLAFETPDQAIAALECIKPDLPKHARAARQIAAEYFDARKVLTKLLVEAGASKSRRTPMPTMDRR